MNKRISAFTMVEMLGVTILIVCLFLFSVFTINSITNQSKNPKYNNFLKIINNAADKYIELNFDKYNNSDSQYVGVKKLIENGLIDQTLINPNTKEQIIKENGIIKITKYNDKTVSYDYLINSYYQIDYIEDLVEFSNNVKNGNNYQNKVIILNNSLDFRDINSYKDNNTNYGDINGDNLISPLLTELTTMKGFYPIGDISHPFKGVFIGNANVINNLFINRPQQDEVGLFGCIENGRVSDLFLKGTVNGKNNTGLLSGKVLSNSLLENIQLDYSSNTNDSSNIGSLSGNIENSIVRKISSNFNIIGNSNNIGGIVGTISTSSTQELTSYGVINESNQNIGGIFGEVSNTSINDAKASGNISGTTNVGGIAGIISNNSLTLERISNSASISAKNKVGGLFGLASNLKIKKSSNSGVINGNDFTGGLVGEISASEIETSSSTGTVFGISNVGGLLGQSLNTTMSNCYNISSVSGINKIGGLIGTITSSIINNSYTVSPIIGTSEMGGLIGVADSNSAINYSFYNTNRNDLENIIGTDDNCTITHSLGMPNDEMLFETTYTNWDFTNIWQIQSGFYPLLK